MGAALCNEQPQQSAQICQRRACACAVLAPLPFRCWPHVPHVPLRKYVLLRVTRCCGSPCTARLPFPCQFCARADFVPSQPGKLPLGHGDPTAACSLITRAGLHRYRYIKPRLGSYLYRYISSHNGCALRFRLLWTALPVPVYLESQRLCAVPSAVLVCMILLTTVV